MLYWYALQNLNMGTYTLHAEGSGGFTIGGIAAVVVIINREKPKKTVVVYSSPKVREEMLALAGEYMDRLSHLDGLTPLPDPPKGVVVIERHSPANESLNTAIQKATAQLSRLNSMTPLPNPPKGVIIVQKDVHGNEAEINDAILKAKSKLSRLAVISEG
jgi:hypothetical protein